MATYAELASRKVAGHVSKGPCFSTRAHHRANRSSPDLLNSRVLVADGAMGTMLQAQGDLDLERDFQGLEGCNEVLNLTRPDVVSAVHRAYLEAGSDCVETNTFGTNLAALAEYGIVDRLAELAGAGARIARETADGFTDKPRFVLGSVGPGTKLPSLEHIAFVSGHGRIPAKIKPHQRPDNLLPNRRSAPLF